MNGGLSDLGKQIAGDVFELGKGVAKGVVKATGDIAVDVAETAISGGQKQSSDQGKQLEKGKSDDQNQTSLIKKQKEKRQFQEVKNELAEYIQRKKQLDVQIMQEKQEEEKQKKQKNAIEKQEKESFLQQLMKSLARNSHGEGDRQKE